MSALRNPTERNAPFIPTDPPAQQAVAKPSAVQPAQPEDGAGKKESLTLASLVKSLINSAVGALPRQAATISARMGIAFVVNTALWSIPTWRLSGALKGLVALLVFLTASYNNVVSKTIFWVIVMTVGVRLFRRVRNNGFATVYNEFAQVVPRMRKSWKSLESRAVPMVLLGGGIGFALANFLSRNNRIDKMLVCYLLAITIADSITRAQRGMVFLFAQAAVNDIGRLLRRSPGRILPHVSVAGTACAAALCLNTLFSLLHVDYGGYILGAVLLAASVGMVFTARDKTAAPTQRV
jgi:hypothetical protein